MLALVLFAALSAVPELPQTAPATPPRDVSRDPIPTRPEHPCDTTPPRS